MPEAPNQLAKTGTCRLEYRLELVFELPWPNGFTPQFEAAVEIQVMDASVRVDEELEVVRETGRGRQQVNEVRNAVRQVPPESLLVVHVGQEIRSPLTVKLFS